ncbi:MAG: DUF2520 domain-containing protein [Flavobacteriales bacterium]|nr:DUF2520 domain-containing protein [Flavobacteriales bacterium]
MKSLLIVGTGRLATALLHRLAGLEDWKVSLLGRNRERALSLGLEFKVPVYALEDPFLPFADGLLLAVKDDAVEDLAARFADRARVLIHLSGGLPLSSVGHHCAHAAVVYPLQTFARPREVSWQEIPLFLQATSAEALTFAGEVARALGGPRYESSDLERQRLHLCAVWASNFSRLMLAEAWRLCQQWNLSFAHLLPLIQETFRGALTGDSLTDLITGPAARGDEATMQTHRQLLNSLPEQAELYSLLSKRIQALLHRAED